MNRSNNTIAKLALASNHAARASKTASAGANHNTEMLDPMSVTVKNVVVASNSPAEPPFLRLTRITSGMKPAPLIAIVRAAT